MSDCYRDRDRDRDRDIGGSFVLSAGNTWLRNATVTVTVTVTVTEYLRIIRAVCRQLMVTECVRDHDRDRDR